jgi:hypothetical protein
MLLEGFRRHLKWIIGSNASYLRKLRRDCGSATKRILFKAISAFLKKRVFVTNSNFQLDGLGAQVQRIVSTSALAEAMGLKFCFKQIERIEVQHGDSYSNEEELQLAIKEFNDFYENPNGEFNSDQEINSLEIRVESSYDIVRALVIAIFQNKSVLVSLDNAFFFTDKFPELQISVIQKRIHRNPDLITALQHKKSLNIQLHLRSTTVSPMSDRYIPESYYLDCLRMLTEFATSSNLKYLITIHTDIQPGKSDNPLVEKFASRETIEYWKSIGQIRQSGESNAEVKDMGSATLDNILKNFPTSEILTGITPLQSWKVMSFSDFLITSKSSFSALGGMFASDAVVITPPGFNPVRDLWFEWGKSDMKRLKFEVDRVVNKFLVREA